MWHSYLQGKMNIISASFGLVANAPWNLSDPQLEQSSRINNIEHNIPLVNKPKLAYTYIEWKQLPT